MFGFNEAELPKVLEAFPAMAPLTIPAGTYAGHDYDQPTVALWNFAIAHQDMPESLAYEITKLAMENPDRMVQIHSAASETLPKTGTRTPSCRSTPVPCAISRKRASPSPTT
jgi:uncharacterized protein